eukprot:COSAG06_NODE_2507_length_6747_cov_38.233604_1_plen_74_part_00
MRVAVDAGASIHVQRVVSPQLATHPLPLQHLLTSVYYNYYYYSAHSGPAFILAQILARHETLSESVSCRSVLG